MSSGHQPEIVNPVPVTEVEPWLFTLSSALLGDPFNPRFAHRIDRWRHDWLAERTWGVRDRGRWVGTLATEPRQLSVPAADSTTTDVTVDALTGVSVAATHRRNGLLTAMIGSSLRAAKDRGDTISALLAAEWPIYGRFGYAPATRFADYTYRPRERGASVRPVPNGLVRQVEPEEMLVSAPSVFEGARRLRPGQIDRPGEWWARELGAGLEPIHDRRHWILHEGVDGADGLLGWRVTREPDLDGSSGAIEVSNLIAADADAYRNLWSYLSGIDAVGEITLANRPVDEPIQWLLDDGRALRQQYCGDLLWVALLDVPGALRTRGYAVPGRLVLEVVDETPAGYAGGRVRLDASAAGVQCEPTAAGADLRLPARVLAAAYLGGHRIRALALAGGVDEFTPGAVTLLDAMFGTGLAPWNPTPF